MNISLTRSILIVVGVIFVCIVYTANLSFSNDEPWKNEFNEICGNTQEAVILTDEELKLHVEQCDQLISTIEATDNPRKKLYIFRLNKCRNFYQYISNARKNGRIGK